MTRAWLGWGFGIVLCGCGPDGEMAVDTEDGSGTGTTDASATTPTSVTNATTAGSNTAASMSATGADDDPTGDPPDPDTTGTATGTDAADEPPCPPGELDCPCDVGSSCDGDLMCVDGTCIAQPPCEGRDGEPNDDEASASELADLACGGDDIVVAGTLDGVDMDWFTAATTQGGLCFGDPSATVTADVDVSVCIFAECVGAQTNVSCGFGPGSPDPETSPDGVDGCCSVGDVQLGDVSCFGPNQNYTIWVRVSAAEDACVEYELTLAY